MFYKLGKKFFNLCIDFLKFIQVSLVFLSFFVILYWLLQLGGATFIGPIAPFFEQIRNITHLFYSRIVTMDQITVDFSFLIATFAFLFIAWILKFVINIIESIEDKYDAIYKYLKNRAEELFNFGLEQQYLIQERKNNKFLMLVRLNAVDMTKDSFFNRNVNVGVEEKQKNILEDFASSFDENIKCKKRFFDKDILLYFNNFNDIDRVLSHTQNIIVSIKHKYWAEKWDITSFVSVETYLNVKEVPSKIDKLIMLVNLGLKDKIACLATFKQRYLLIKYPKYTIEEKGVYKINGNEEVFCIKSLK